MTYSRIAVSTDFSEASFRSFPVAASLARKFLSEIHVVHLAQISPAMIAPWPEVGPFVMPDNILEDVERKLVEVIAREPSFEGLTVKPRVAMGEVVDVLADVIQDAEIGLLVIASQGLSGVKRFFLGGFVEKVLRSIACPALVIPGPEAGERPGPFHPTRILIPNDFSVTSQAAAARAREWARTFGARARLLFVVEQTASLYDYAARMEGSYAEYLEKVRLEALERFRRRIRDEWKDVEAEAGAVVGEPAEEILRDAKAFGADLIVLGAHSRSDLARFFLGSVTQKVLRKSHTPILVVRGG
ncbi:MAG TPA: universal stress protein [Planctomycetota bacterium]|nr:universal stress protein [Planctomycetota bacterium]